ncbi:hypothetical protein EV207_11384 [Scopulibacillus darangshiensis]|uniref:Uncharacterized protein n=1 Tax=Scopulibacillus darangshiensis TaxID=442528 RepID=A0A4R2P4G8_9BACL|nr:hypothetical protein [Scopulibacillus darangshiensis]TCP29048.1 hypothetical protein EV207_11384 [Scopulibacillus darangshiensis]
MGIVYYDNTFNENEWFIIIVIIILNLLIFLLPRRFPFEISAILYLVGITNGVVYDDTIGSHLFDLFDINDDSKYSFMDFMTYFMYGPFAYLLIYIQDRFQLHGILLVTYILIWSVFSTGFETLATLLGVFHYKNGYNLYYSFPIYVFTIGVTYWLYTFITQKDEV